MQNGIQFSKESQGPIPPFDCEEKREVDTLMTARSSTLKPCIPSHLQILELYQRTVCQEVVQLCGPEGTQSPLALSVARGRRAPEREDSFSFNNFQQTQHWERRGCVCFPFPPPVSRGLVMGEHWFRTWEMWSMQQIKWACAVSVGGNPVLQRNCTRAREVRILATQRGPPPAHCLSQGQTSSCEKFKPEPCHCSLCFSGPSFCSFHCLCAAQVQVFSSDSPFFTSLCLLSSF